MNTEHANPALFAALAVAQGEIENASKTSANPHFKSKYADLAEVLNTTRPVFAKHGLSLLQSTEFNGSMVSVTTLVAHKDGGYVTATASCVPAKTDAQGIGAATTYLRRYSAAAMAGIAQEDDDGNAAAHNGKPERVAAITEAQAATLRDLIDATGSNADGFLAYYGIDMLDRLPANKYAEAKRMLDAKQAKAA